MFDATAVQKLLDILQDETGGVDIDPDVQQVLNTLQFLAALHPDSVDEYWDSLPSLKCISSEYINLIGESSGNLKVLVDSEDLTDKIKSIVSPVNEVINDKHGPYTKYTPMYDLYIVKRQKRRRITPINNVILSQFFYVGPPKKYGVPRFPAYAQPMVTGKHVQVHKCGDEFTVFSSSGQKIQTPDKLLSCALLELWQKPDIAENIVFSAVFDNETGDLLIFDVLLYENLTKAYRLPLSKRLSIIESIVTGNHVKAIPYVFVKDEDELRSLEDGKWMLRWKNDRIVVDAPFWFKYSKITKSDYTSCFDAISTIEQEDLPFDFVVNNNSMTISHQNGCVAIDIGNMPTNFVNTFSGKVAIGPRWQQEDKSIQYLYIGTQEENITGEYIYTSTGEMKKSFLQDGIITTIIPPKNARNIEYNPLHIEAMENTDELHDLLPLNAEAIVDEYEKLSDV